MMPRMWFRRTRAAKRATIDAEIRYLAAGQPHPRIDATTTDQSVSMAAHRVRFHDLRQAKELPSLEREGFTLLSHHSSVTDFADVEQSSIYRAELERLLREVTGSSHVYLSPELVLRSQDPAPAAGLITDGFGVMVHSDRTDRSVRSEALATLRHYGIDAMPEGRLVAYNVWRAVSPPPQDVPLALCDLRTVREESLVRTDAVGNAASVDEDLEFYLALFDAGHRWCYFSDLTIDEVLLFQQYDTAASGPSGCLHTAFHDPTCTNAVTSRRSVEARAYVFFPA
jgi:hypothetical protein